MRLLIVVDKLLTGFDAPPATYLYIDKPMQDHGLFQAICRVNRLDGDDKEYGYIVDYRDLFKSLERSIHDYTSEAFDGYDQEDVEGLLTDRLEKARERLEEAREAVKALCEPVAAAEGHGGLSALLLRRGHDRQGCAQGQRAEADRALQAHRLPDPRLCQPGQRDARSRLHAAGDRQRSRREVAHFEKVRSEVKLASGDYIDLKMYEPAMRHLLDTYIRAEESEKISAFDDLTLVQLIVERGAAAVDALPAGIRKDKAAVAETIENNLRRVIIDEQPINPKYYEKMSELLDTLIQERKAQALAYEAYLAGVVELAKQVQNPASSTSYPKSLDTTAKRALYDNLGGSSNSRRGWMLPLLEAGRMIGGTTGSRPRWSGMRSLAC